MTSPRRSWRELASLCLALVLVAALGLWQPPASAAAIQAAQTATPAAPSPMLKFIAFSNEAKYPTLTAYVAVWDKTTGQPLAGLTAADFSATIDLTPTAIVAAAPLLTITQNVQVALLIDNSLNDDLSLTKVKAAVNHFVDTLDPASQVALLTVADTAKTLVPLTGDRQQIKAALATVPRVVTKTGLHQGLAEAVTLLSTAPALPNVSRLVVAITNTGDNAAPTFPPDQVASQAQAASVALQVINFTSVDSGHSLNTLAQQTGGRYYPLTKADQIDAVLQTLLSNLQQGYAVSFLSPVIGDGSEHTVSLSLATAASAPPVQARFVAPLKTIVINGPGVTEGQTVIGAVQLATEAVVPAPPITSVEYRLDGQTFATLTTTPYTFQWDSTSVNPGRHRLKVVVRDSGGNLGEAEVTVLVALPFAVTASSDREQVAVGDKMVIRAQVSSPARIDRVEFLQGDGVLLSSDTIAPYECSLDTKGQAPGIKTFKVRAVDYLGRSTETDVFHIELRPTLASTSPTLWRWGLIGLNTAAILAALLIALFGSLALSARLKRRLQSSFALEIMNEGNTRNRYSLRAEAALEALHLEFRQQGAALPVQTLLVSPPPALMAAPEAEPAPGLPAPQTGLSVGAVKQTGAFKSYQKVSGIGATLGGFLNTIAGVLPQGAATPLRNAATSLRQGESLSYEVDRADGQVKALQHASSDAAASLGGSPAEAPVAASAPAPRPPQAQAQYLGASETWALTPYVEPGEKLSLQLCAKPLKSTHTQTYGVRILSRLVDAPDVAPVSEAGNITVAGLSGIQRLQPFLLALTMLAVAVGLTALLVRIWGG